MDISIFLAQAWGIVLLISSLSIFFAQESYRSLMTRAKEMEDAILMSGVVALIFGTLHILAYNSWTPDWRGLITILGWLAFLKGLLRLWAPRLVVRIARKMNYRWLSAMAFLFFILGAYLAWIGFSPTY